MAPRDRVAIVTGGGQGIGKAITLALLERGWRVVIGELDVEAGREAVAELSHAGEVRLVAGDVSREATARKLAAAARRAFGGLDLLVNNAGIGIWTETKVTELALDDWNRVIGTNLTGAFLCAKHAAPLLAERRGSIVNIASTRALQSEPHTEAYAASKGGLVALTHALAVSLGPAVRVNCVSPGWIEVADWKKRKKRKAPAHSRADHAQHPAGRIGTPRDVADAVIFLAGNGFATGANLVLDGGMTRKMIYV